MTCLLTMSSQETIVIDTLPTDNMSCGDSSQELASDFLERWNRQPASINVQLHARAASDDAVDVLAH